MFYLLDSCCFFLLFIYFYFYPHVQPVGDKASLIVELLV